MYDQLLEYVRDVYGWLESGAYRYVCDDKARLSAAIHKALVSVVQQQSGASLEEAEAYVRGLHQPQPQLEEAF
ncbi:hypothetical protein [Hymenobacter jeollabukensis]|uniref:Uncharacterized protein n=1 Tax=Hymenobacter jeollabukensis TaxID=2025313 RepID=A0A5R8WVP6_9BACT|nr:hypothetical protein [Hymenobacter jeollabukensis]TLM95486.1 hypothetical protein FDY95_06780 [Hymenobacter jeollabukensis]